MMMNARTDRNLIRSHGDSRRYVLVELNAPESPPREGRLPVNIALVLDRSGSMGGQKIARAREAAVQAIRLLRPEDRFAVVAYDDVVDVIFASTQATPAAREEAIRRLAGIDARGSTDLHTGWLRGCEQVAQFLRAEEVGKVLLLSDGLANHGVIDPGTLAREAGELRARGVLTSTFGVGSDFDERLMQAVANQGGGHFYFIERPEQIPDFLQGELGETLEIVAREVELHVRVPEGAAAELLHDHPTEPAADGLRCRLGSLVSGQRLSLLVAVTFPAGVDGDAATVALSVSDRDLALDLPELGVTFRYAGHAQNDTQPRDTAVDRVVAAVYAERARREAVEHNRAGDFRRAQRALTSTAGRIREYAGDDADLRALARTLEGEVAEYGEPMDALELKRRHYGHVTSLRSRDAGGRALRGRQDGGERYVLDTAAGHPIADIGGVRCLLDTGSPVTIGRTCFRILGVEHQPQEGLGAVDVAEVSRLIGSRVDVLLGTDVLGGFTWVLDWPGGSVRFLPGPGHLAGRNVPASLRHGIPAIEIDAGGHDGSRLAFLDTGARLSYMDPADVDGAAPLGEEEDFFPLVGRFRVPVYGRMVMVAGEPFHGSFGTLPSALGLALGLTGVTWVLGCGILRGREVLFDLQRGRIVLGHPGGAPSRSC